MNGFAAQAGHASRPRVIVVGGGFAGLSTVKALKNAPVNILLIDRRNHHVFQPLLYQVATAMLPSGDIASRSARSRNSIRAASASSSIQPIRSWASS